MYLIKALKRNAVKVIKRRKRKANSVDVALSF
jgi:hypothetical protein